MVNGEVNVFDGSLDEARCRTGCLELLLPIAVNDCFQVIEIMKDKTIVGSKFWVNVSWHCKVDNKQLTRSS
jgi:hypothetical protein